MLLLAVARWACSLVEIQMQNQGSICSLSEATILAVQLWVWQAGVSGSRDLCRLSTLLQWTAVCSPFLLTYSTTRCQGCKNPPALLGMSKEFPCADYGHVRSMVRHERTLVLLFFIFFQVWKYQTSNFSVKTYFTEEKNIELRKAFFLLKDLNV